MNSITLRVFVCSTGHSAVRYINDLILIKLMKLPANIRFVNRKLKESLNELEKNDHELAKFINQALDNIEENAFCGIQIPKKLIPKKYLSNYNIKNLWKYDLPKGWRLMYSIESEEIVVVALILEWSDHKEYERRFKY